MASTPLNLVILLVLVLTGVFVLTTLQPPATPKSLPSAEPRQPSHNHLDANSTNHLFWFVQISDLHISHVHDPTRITSFRAFCQQVLALIKPKVLLASGDLTDGKKPNFADSDQFLFEWQAYEAAIRDSLGSSATTWLDVRGNHDNFNVLSRNKPNNFFQKYAIKKSFSRSYMHQVTTDSGDRYSFIGVDACTEPGAKRPYNFFGSLEEADLALLSGYAAKSRGSTATVWFGHYPTTTVHSSRPLAEVMANGGVYLCGHLHNLLGLMKRMYARHGTGMLELELADWKDNRV